MYRAACAANADALIMWRWAAAHMPAADARRGRAQLVAQPHLYPHAARLKEHVLGYGKHLVEPWIKKILLVSRSMLS